MNMQNQVSAAALIAENSAGQAFADEMIQHFSTRAEIGHEVPITLDEVCEEIDGPASDYGIVNGDEEWCRAEEIIMDWIIDYHENA